MKEKVTIKKVCSRPKTGTMPTLLRFQNGFLASINKERTQYCRLTSVKDNMKKVAMVVASGEVYMGPLGATEAEELTDTYICVRNKTTNTVRIIPIEQVHLRNNIYKELEKKRLNPMTSEDTMKTLLKKFGGRRAHSYATNSDQMRMNIDMVKNELEATAQEANIEPEEVKSENYDSIAPKFNKDAANIQDIYDVNDVVPAELLNRLDEEAKALSSTDVTNLPIKSEYLRKCIQAIQDSTPSNKNFLKMKLIIFMDCLYNLIKLRCRYLKDVELSGITEKVENYVRSNFGNANGSHILRTKHTIEKSLCYFIVLALLVGDNYQVDLNMLAEELQMPKRKIITFGHVVNAPRKSKSDTLALVLPSRVAPLPMKMIKRKK